MEKRRYRGRVGICGQRPYLENFAMEASAFTPITLQWRPISWGSFASKGGCYINGIGVEYGYGNQRRRKLECNLPVLPGEAGDRSDLRSSALAHRSGEARTGRGSHQGYEHSGRTEKATRGQVCGLLVPGS